MLPGLTGGAAQGALGPDSTMREVIHALGLSANLKLILDAGDNASVASASQAAWSDVSGNGYDFNRGASSASAGDDPTFTGTVGGRSSSDYYALDGGDSFTYDSSNESWMNAIGQNSALFTMAGWVYMTANTKALAGTDDPDVNNSSWQFVVTSGTKMLFRAFNATGDAVNMTSSAAFPLNAWTFFAVSVNEAAGTGFLQINSTQESFTTTYASPLAPGSAVAMRIAALGGGTLQPASGSRYGAFMAWQGGTNLSTAQGSNLFQATRGKYGI
jgi:hypothetical protein